MVAVKALACELSAKAEQAPAPGSLAVPGSGPRRPVEQGIAASISGTTIWRWLSGDAIKPWQYRSWIFPVSPTSEPRRLGSST